MSVIPAERQTSRNSNRLKGRRVCIDGRTGTITSSYIWGRNGSGSQSEEPTMRASVLFDDYAERKQAFDDAGGYKQTRPFEVPAPTWDERIESLLEEHLLPAPEIAAPVRIRRVMFRGHKDQVAERWARMSPLSDEQIAAGYDRYVEFQPDVAAYKRWRIVTVLPPMDPQRVAETPDEHPRAASERRSRRDNGYDEPDSYGMFG